MKFVVYAPPFDELSGGVIALHALCDRLNALGFTARLWPWGEPPPTVAGRLRRVARAMRGLWRGETVRYETGPFARRMATDRDLRGAVVIYPEVVSGNPLKGRKVVRWLLHKPGFHNGKVEFGSNDLYFFYQDAFNCPALNPNSTNRLTISWINPVYREAPAAVRTGACYIVRKGRTRPDLTVPEGALIIDDLSPDEVAQAFNSHARVISYDTYTQLCIYAAICGCLPVVVPEAGVSRDQWYPNENDRLGMAYGFADENWALETRQRLLDRLDKDMDKENDMLRLFVEKCARHFGSSA